jgi:hypothetical protein
VGVGVGAVQAPHLLLLLLLLLPPPPPPPPPQDHQCQEQYDHRRHQKKKKNKIVRTKKKNIFELGPFNSPAEELWKLKLKAVAESQQLFGPGTERDRRENKDMYRLIHSKFRPASATRRVQGRWNGEKVLDIDGLSRELPHNCLEEIRKMSMRVDGLVVERHLRNDMIFDSRV